MKRAAFSMIELVFVIVVLGILAALAMPRMERDIRQEAIDNIIAAIKYTQHLALNDNIIDASDQRWQRKYWRFSKRGCSDNGIFYCIASDRDMQGNFDVTQGEVAVDPANGMYMIGKTTEDCENGQEGASPNIFLTKKYGIRENRMTFSGSCGGQGWGKYVAFDYLGRPHYRTSLAQRDNVGWNVPSVNDCNITLQFDDGSAVAVITVEKETGRVYLAQ